jgi:hypothetical protein
MVSSCRQCSKATARSFIRTEWWEIPLVCGSQSLVLALASDVSWRYLLIGVGSLGSHNWRRHTPTTIILSVMIGPGGKIRIRSRVECGLINCSSSWRIRLDRLSMSPRSFALLQPNKRFLLTWANRYSLLPSLQGAHPRRNSNFAVFDH